MGHHPQLSNHRRRAWLLQATPILALLGTSGCLISSPPELSDPQTTRPYIWYQLTVPPLGEPIRIVLTEDKEILEPVPFTIPFQSEDLGRSVLASLHINAKGQTPRLRDQSAPMPPGSFDEVRELTFEYNPTGDIEVVGCYKFAVTLAHSGSFGDNGFIAPGHEDDAEQVSWLAYVESPNDTVPIAFEDCPQVGDIN